jgi:hypothetical protein
MRPRDVIQFFNCCISNSDGKPTITVAAFREAEGQYSRDRLKALFDEWSGLYPNLGRYFQLLKGRGQSFSVHELTLEEIQDNVLQILASGHGQPGIDLDMMETAFETGDFAEWRRELVFLLYKVSLLGLKVDAKSPFSWSHLTGVSISSAEISPDTRVLVHKTFWRVLGISDDRELV